MTPPSPTSLIPGLPTAGPAACPLDDWGVIRASGADAASFLQGQLTQDVTGLAPGQSRLAGYCSPKGRLIASFVVSRESADEFLLALSADLLAATQKRLSMFVLRAKCKLVDASAAHRCWGLAGPRAWADAAIGPVGGTVLADGAPLVRLADAEGLARALRIAPADRPAPAPDALDPAAWRWLEVMSGVPRVVAATVDAFVPQMINFEAVGGVDFRKGCYPGQEVVARSQYRGTIKRRAFPAIVAPGDGASAAPGEEVFVADDPSQPAGQVVLAADWPGAGDRARVALVEAKLSAAEAATALRLRSVDGPRVTLLPLPYELPTI